MTERPVHATLRSMLLNNDAFDYCHLIKFERPSLPDAASGKISTSKERYAYITDASRDVLFDDNSSSLLGVANGTQTYIANKVMKVGSITEDSEAKATTFNIDLDGTSVGAYISDTINTSVVSTGVYDIKFTTADLVEAGFREGDKITITGISAPGDYNIHSFRYNNNLRVTKIDTTMSPQSGVPATVSLASEEIKSILLDKNSEGYSSFINREIFVWKAFFNEGTIVGEPILIFKGLISNVNFEDSESGVKVSWGMTSHWGDWSQVSGRITSDDFHRALDSNGNPNPLSALKPLYAYDKGFSHAETSINLLANYTTLVEKQDVTVKKTFFGLSSKVKVRNYLSPETRSTELDFQLQAKSLPVIYGVRPTAGIPIFADTLKNDSSTVYVAYALAEGEVASIYDVYISGNSLICGNKADYDARAVQTPDKTVSLVCMGRADRGDVLGGAIATSGSPVSYYSSDTYLYDIGYNLIDQVRYTNYTEPVVTAPVTSTGIKDGETLTLTSPQQIVLDFFSGKEAQKASQSLVNIAKSNNFKVQSDYWSGTDTAEYWGPNHRLLDTAYVVAKYKIADGETTIPDLQFIVNGKVIPCYNYDYSYSQHIKATGESEANFKLGAFVDVYRSDTNAIINSSVQIIDKWTIYNPDGTANVRFRLSSPPALGYVDGVPAITKFYLKSGANTWTMVTYNYKEHLGSPAENLTTTVSAVSNASGSVRITYPTKANLAIGGDAVELAPKYALLDTTTMGALANERFGDAILSGTVTSTTLTTEYSYTNNSTYANNIVGSTLVSMNTIRLAATASSVNDYYNKYNLVITKTDSVTGKQIVQTKTIVAYDGTTKVATIDGVWDTLAIPSTSDTYYLVQAYVDNRVSTNFAIQLLDYSTAIYGRNLDLDSDIGLDSWLNSARLCDARSDITLRLASGSAPSTGAVYKLANTAGDTIWQGTVSESYTSNVPGAATTFVVFTNIIGKATNMWNSWKAFKEGEIVYSGNNVYKVTSGYVAGTTAPTHTTGTTANLTYLTSLAITKVSGIGGSTLALSVSSNPVQAVNNGRIASGYSLYDSDGIDYWKYVGWSAQEQRYVTQHQGNMSIDTSQPIFDNTNSILSHFGGILRYSGGRYYLDVETKFTDTITAEDPYNITEDDIIGKINLTDEGIRGAYNSLAVSYADPSNKFEARNISFFNSDYLKADRNVARKGNLSIPGITNYYNGRLLADKYLNKSRFGLSISITIRPKGALLVPGRVMQVQYSRYGWTDKKFIIESVTIAEDCLVDVVAKEYDDSFYSVSNISRQAGSGISGLPISNSFEPPTSLSAVNLEDNDDTRVTINVSWVNSTTSNATSTSTELYCASKDMKIVTINTGNLITISSAHALTIDDTFIVFTTTNGLTAGTTYYVATTPSTTTITLKTVLGAAVTLTSGTGLTIWAGTQKLLNVLAAPIEQFKDIVYGSNVANKYYRVRHRIAQTNVSGVTVDNYSEYYPTLASTAILGSTSGAPPVITGALTKEAVALPASSAGTVSSYSLATGSFLVYSDGVLLSTGVVYSVSASSSSTGTINSSTGVFSVSAISADSASITLRAVTAGVTLTKVFSLTKVRAGTNGTNGIDGVDGIAGTNGTNGTNGIDGVDGSAGSAGTPAVGLVLTNEAITVFAYADGSVPSFAGIDGILKVYNGATDVTASATLSATASGLTGTINTDTNSPATGVKGYYRVTALPGESGTLTLSATYNSVTYTKVFSVSKVKTGYEIVSSLPTTGNFVGRMVFLTTDSKLYRYNGTSFIASVPANDITGLITGSQLSNGIIDNTKVASTVNLPLLVNKANMNDGTVVAHAGGALAYNVYNGKLYRNSNGGALATSWAVIVQDATDLSGTLTDAQIATLAATKITGTITNTQIGTDAIDTPQLRTDSVKAAEIYAGSVIAGKLATDAVTAGNILAGQVTAGKLGVDAVVAGNINAGVIGAREVATGAITAGKMAIGSLDNLIANPNSEEAYTSGDGSLGLFNAGAAAYNGSFVRRIVTSGATESSIVFSGVPCQPGSKFYFESMVKAVSGSPTAGVYLDFRKADGSAATGGIYSETVLALPANSIWQKAYVVAQAPTAAAFVVFYLLARDNTSTVYFDGLYARRMLEGSLIVDGSIKGNKIEANSIDTGQLAAGAVTTNILEAGAVTAAKIGVTDLSAISANIGTITAGVIRNSASTFGINANASVIVTFAGSYMKITGAAFGTSGDLMEWWGITPSGANISDPKLSTLTKANAAWALGTDGKAYYKGAPLSSLEVFENKVATSTNLSTSNAFMNIAYEHTITVPSAAKFIVQFNAQMFFPSTGDINGWLTLNSDFAAAAYSSGETLMQSGVAVPNQTYMHMKNSGTYETLGSTTVVLNVSAGTHRISFYGNQITGGTATIRNTSTIITAIYS